MAKETPINPGYKTTGPRDEGGIEIVDSNGNVVDTVNYGEGGIVGRPDQVVYSQGNGRWTADISQVTPSLSMDDVTGKITIRAPQSFFDSEVYKQNFNDDVFKGLTRLYRQNKDAKVQMADGTDKTVKEVLETWNEKLPDLVNGWLDYDKKKNTIGERYGEEDRENFTLKSYQLMGTSAYSGRDDDLLVIPNTLLNGKWSFFKDLPGFDAETGTISLKDFRDGYYHLSAFRDLAKDTGIANLKQDASKALSEYSGGDVDEFSRLIAFNNFLSEQAQEGANISPDASFGNKLIVGGYAVGESAMRTIMRTGVDFTNFVTNALLIPFSAVDWAGNLITTGKSQWEWINIIDKTMGVLNYLSGGDDFSVFGYETVDQIMDAEYAKRGNFYNLTNTSVALAYTLTYTAGSFAIRLLQTKALNNLVLNAAALGISRVSLGKQVSTVAGQLSETKIVTEAGEALTPKEMVMERVRDTLIEGGTSENVVNLLTGTSNLTFKQTMDLLVSINPADFISAVYQWSGLVNTAGEYLRSGALSNLNTFAEWYKNSATTAMGVGDWKTYGELTSKFKKYYEELSAIYTTGNSLAITSAKTLATLKNYSRFVPALYYTSQVIVGTYLSESENIKKLIQGVDSAEERDIIWGIVGRTIAGWTIGAVAGAIWNKVKLGFATPAVEKANAATTERMAKVETAISGRMNQVREVLSGKDWVDNIKNPVKKSVVKYNQALQKSQEYMAQAADQVRAVGGTKAEATTATLEAMNQMRANQNAIDLMQNTDLVVASWHTVAYPAYSSAEKNFTEIDKAVMDKLTALGLDKDEGAVAPIGGIDPRGGLPQDLVNYMTRALQRASYLRDDVILDASVATEAQLAKTPDLIPYQITDPSFLLERNLAQAYMTELEQFGKYPKALLDYIKQTWVPAAQQAMHQLNQIEMAAGYDLRSRTLGWGQSGMFGKNNELYFPTQRITQAQKDFEEAVRNPMEISRRGAIKRQSYDPKHYVPGSEENTDFVSPMVVFRKVENQKAIDYAINEFKKANLSNPLVKNVTKLDGEQTGAVKTYEDLEPSYKKGVERALGSIKEDLDVSGLVSDMLSKQKMETKIRNAQKAVDKAKETRDRIPDIEVKVSRADKLRTIEGLPEDMVDSLLQKAGIEFEGEKVDTRKWLNSQVPGFDILDWSLLGRTHTNGLVEGGLYSGMGDTYVKAYLMDLDDLRGITKLDKNTEDMSPDAIEKIRKDINTEGGEAVIPLYFDVVSGEKRFFPQTRWGHSGDRFPDWETYFNYLASKGITKVPVAIDFSKRALAHEANLSRFLEAVDKAIATGKRPDVDYKDVAVALRELGTRERVIKRLRDSAPEEEFSWGDIKKLVDKAEEYNIKVANGEITETFDDLDLDSQAKAMMRIHNYFKDFDVQDITSDVQQAFSEYGQIPFYHGQHAPLGTMEYNDPEGARELYRGAGDAYWLAPNSSYTDTYGKNKLAGTIPVKYFMSDKEKNTTSNALAKELRKLRDKAAQKGLAELRKEDDRILKNIKQEVLHTQKDSIDDAMAQFNLHEAGWSSDLEEKYGAANYYVDNLGLLYKGKHHFIDGNMMKKLPAFDFTFTPLDEIYHTPLEENRAIEDGSKLLPKKDKARYDELSRIVEPYTDGQKSSKVVSYRALAEYAKKPIIDISEDGFADGTAFFYYKGVDPKFDEEVGQQLASQAMFQNENPQWSGEAIASAMENYDGMSLDEMIDNITNGEGWGEDWDTALEDFENGEVSSSELTEDFQERISRVAKKYPGIAKIMEETWDNNTIQDLRDMKFKYWHPSTGYPTVDDTYAGMFLDEMGETRPGARIDDVPEGQRSFYDMIVPTAENIPAYSEQDLTDISLRNLETKRKILKKELRKRCG